MTLTLSLGQMNVHLGDPAANLERVRAWTAEAARRGSALVLFPELWSTGYDLENWQRHASPPGEGLFAQLAELAREHRIAIGGSVLEARNGRAYNAFALFDAGGGLSGTYRKTHLFRLMNEEKWLAPGERLELVEADWGLTGLGICYDLRFPEMFRHYALRGARLALLPAEWPARRAYHWQTLLRARAIENQMYLAGCNRVGEANGEVFGGGSAVIDPWGETVVEGGSTEALLTAEIDLAQADAVRKRIPVFEDRRPEIY
ncbi:MAG: carbon-nitrogen family hydrolase [Anaerolineales bacterium]|nr:carbon-nitrogen family hydrolase [Anaerolineales bacterium]